MQHHHAGAVGWPPVDKSLHVAGAAAPGHHLRMQAVGQGQDGLLLRQQLQTRRLRVRRTHHLHLPDEHRVRAFGGKTAAEAGDAGGPRQAGDDGRLLHHQRHHIVPPVDEKVQPQPPRAARKRRPRSRSSCPPPAPSAHARRWRAGEHRCRPKSPRWRRASRRSGTLMRKNFDIRELRLGADFNPMPRNLQVQNDQPRGDSGGCKLVQPLGRPAKTAPMSPPPAPQGL